MTCFVSQCAAETLKFGERLGKKLRAGDVVLLSGELGTGKTTLAKGIARGLRVRDPRAVSSPTFVLIHEYAGRVKVYHLDWYRLKALRGEDALLVQECLADPTAVTLIEWPQRGAHLLPKRRTEIRLRHEGGDRREIFVEKLGEGKG